MRPRISVIVPFHDARAQLPALVDALRAQSVPSDAFEVIWVDDGSHDGGGAWLEQHLLPNWRLVVLPACRGSYAARNSGVGVASADALAFTDVDCRPQAEWLEQGLAGLAIAPRVAGRIQLELSSQPSIAELVDAGRFLRQRRYMQEGFAATANLFVRRDTFEAVGGFDGGLRSGGDQEFGWRCSRAGVPIHYAERAVVSHAARASVRELLRKSERVGFGMGQVLRRGRMPLPTLARRALERSSVGMGRRVEERLVPTAGPPQSLRVAAVHLLVVLVTVAGGLTGALTGGSPSLARRLTPRRKDIA
jgi:GT2 family glycosyltransferase